MLEKDFKDTIVNIKNEIINTQTQILIRSRIKVRFSKYKRIFCKKLKKNEKILS